MMDIEDMFAAAATAAEDTNEGNVGGKEKAKAEAKPAPKPEPVKEPTPKPEPVKEKEPEIVSQPTKTTKPTEETKSESVKPEPKEERREPVVASKDRGIANSGVTKDSISKILEMSAVFSKFSSTEKDFVVRYFGLELNDKDLVAGVVYSALTANQRELDAISKLVTARGESPAERAFYLMGLDNNSVEAVAEQVDLLTGDLGNVGRVNSENKIAICRKIENSISSMRDDVFAYIIKLQSFTYSALN